MSVPTSKKTKTPEEKLAFERAHRDTPLDFNKRIDTHIKIASALFTLAKKLDKGGPRSKLRFNTTSGLLEFTRSDLYAAQRAYIAQVRDLKAVFRVSRKTEKSKPTPESFKAVYGAVYMAPALRAFFNPADPALFGYVNPLDETSGYLIDMLPVARQGYIQRNTCSTLFHIYASANGLHYEDNGQQIKLEQHFLNCFGSDDAALAAPFFKVAGAQNKVPNDRVESTFAAIMRGGFMEKKGQKDKQVTEAFDPVDKGYYLMTSFSNISSLNYYNETLIEKDNLVDENGNSILATIQDGTYRQSMVDETYIVNGTKNIWKAWKEESQKDKKKEKKKASDAAKKAAKKAAGGAISSTGRR